MDAIADDLLKYLCIFREALDEIWLVDSLSLKLTKKIFVWLSLVSQYILIQLGTFPIARPQSKMRNDVSRISVLHCQSRQISSSERSNVITQYYCNNVITKFFLTFLFLFTNGVSLMEESFFDCDRSNGKVPSRVLILYADIEKGSSNMLRNFSTPGRIMVRTTVNCPGINVIIVEKNSSCSEVLAYFPCQEDRSSKIVANCQFWSKW